MRFFHKAAVLKWGFIILGISLLSLFAQMASPSLAAPGLNPDQVRPASQPNIGLAQLPSIWQDIDEIVLRGQPGGRAIVPQKYRLVAADIAALRQLLATAPLENSTQAQQAAVILPLPLPNGQLGHFQIEEAPIMEAPLQAKYPAIKTYRAWGLDDLTATARLDFTPAGFHAIILSAQGTMYIDPYRRGDIVYYISYDKQDFSRATQKTIVETIRPSTPQAVLGSSTTDTTGNIRYTYRLAVAAAGEYTQYHGGTVEGALAAITTSINRVTGIYEREVSVRLILIADNDQIIFTNRFTDPYGPFGNLTANQITLDNIIGSANYDIGHLFTVGGGGVAGLGVVCNDAQKAMGLTGSNDPIGDPFDIDFVAHEIGHQFNANHTFNAGNAGSCSSGNREGSTAYEPGSGSTIMAYAGICAPQNLQLNSDDYFHTISFSEISDFVQTGGGSTCANTEATGNTAPTVEAGPPYTIPVQTPFMLTGTATDTEQSSLTYGWEQFDLGPAATGVLPNTDNGSSPIFRSYQPVTHTWRSFPNLDTLLLGALSNIGESLPTTSRTMNFRLTARDGLGGVNFDTTQVTTVNAAGPFRIIEPTSGNVWVPLSQSLVTWDVANTDSAPINCSQVNILLSTDGGQTFPTSLQTNTPNDGLEVISVPDVSDTNTARVKVTCADNIFFHISPGDFTIQTGGTVANIVMNKTVGNNPAVCATTDSLTIVAETLVTYCYTIQNIGNITLTTHTLIDDQLGTLLSSSPYTLAPGAMHSYTTSATITTTTVNNAIWAATDAADNSAQASASATVTFTGIISTYGLTISPNQAAQGKPGETITSTISITNTGNAPDTVDLTTLSTWTTDVSTETVRLNPLEGTTIRVFVQIPSSAVNDDQDTITLTAISRNDITASAMTTVTVTVAGANSHTYLPMVVK